MPHNITSPTDQAPIVHRSETEICFRVDDVVPSPIRLPLTHARQQFEKRLARPLQAFTHEQASDIVLEKHGIEHGLVHAVYLAFSEHRPLVLTPDVIWIALAQGFAQHLNLHAEALRSRMVSHKGKVTMEASAFELVTPEDWNEVIQQWSTGIQSHVPAELYQLMLCDFSTTTPIIRTASQVVMLDAFQQYFDYALYFICGIPTITVKGTVQDWLSIRTRVDVMAGYHLEWWTDRLKPICDGFIDTVQGHPSQTFWKHIFSPKEVYGGSLITGWLADLFPYIKDSITEAPTVRNPILEIPRAHLISECGLSPKRVPTGLSRAPFIIKSSPGHPGKEMELIAGFIGVKQEVNTGQLEPEIGWAVLEQDETSRVLSLLTSVAAPGEPPQKEAMPHTEQERHKQYALIDDTGMPKECVRLMHNYEDGQVFYGTTSHPWVLRPLSDLTPRQIWSSNVRIFSPGVHFMDLADGRAIVYVPFAVNQHESSSWWIAVGQPDGQQFVHNSVMVIAHGFLSFLQRVTAAEGRYYFDDPEFQPDVML